MKVGAWQFDVRRGDVAANEAAARRGVEAAAEAELALLALPEMWPTSFLSAGLTGVADDALARAVDASEAAVERVAARASELGLALCGSAYGRAPDGGLPCNRFSLWTGGRCRTTYDKVHLFSVTGEPFAFTAGSAPPVAVDVGPARVAGLVCYDLRFAAVVEAARRTGADLLVVPAQWPTPRAAHWHALLVGRAVEAQAFVLGANRTGRESLGRRGRELAFGGDSAVVGPDGAVLARGGPDGAEALVAATIDPAAAADLRRAVRVEDDRRPALYRSWP